jgi:hypothetical protein
MVEAVIDQPPCIVRQCRSFRDRVDGVKGEVGEVGAISRSVPNAREQLNGVLDH